MIAGEVISYVGKKEDPEVSQPELIELTEWGQFIELAAPVGNRRVYLKFRIADLLREIDEAKADKK